MSGSTNDLPIVVVGGGLAGLATTLALGQQGREVRLLEQSAEIAPIGYGVQIGPNVLPILDRLGLAEAHPARPHTCQTISCSSMPTAASSCSASLCAPRPFGLATRRRTSPSIAWTCTRSS